MHPITESVHYIVAKIIKGISPQVSSIIDMGGTGKFRGIFDCFIFDANISNGTDACNLEFDDNSFDITCSVATLEHVENQTKFLEESLRVARNGIVHWFPYGLWAEEVERFRTTLSYKHPCIVPSTSLIKQFRKKYPSLKMLEYINCESHLLLLTSLRPELALSKVYDMSLKMGKNMYGVILYGEV